MGNPSMVTDTIADTVIGLISSQSDEQLRKLAEALGHALGSECEVMQMSANMDLTRHSLFLVDCSCYKPNRIQAWLADSQLTVETPVALYNTEASSLHESLLEWPCVRGFFYNDTTSKQLIDGLQLMLDGDFWVPRRLLHQYLERNRRAPKHHLKAAVKLTKREKQILALLEEGATNATMAEALKVSEHTIKTHLYNVYKKIDAANRIEAINWSRQNLGSI